MIGIHRCADSDAGSMAIDNLDIGRLEAANLDGSMRGLPLLVDAAANGRCCFKDSLRNIGHL